MTVASLMQRLKSGGAVPPVPPWNPDGGTAENAIFRGEMPSVPPVPPVPPQKTVAKNKAVPDPGMAALLALADRYCTAIQASDKARKDWRTDIEATPAEARGGLADYFRGELAKLVPPVAPKPAPPLVTPAKPMPKFSVNAPWRAADSAWLTHWGQCQECKTAGRTSTPRCTQGEALFTTYQQAAEATKESK